MFNSDLMSATLFTSHNIKAPRTVRDSNICSFSDVKALLVYISKEHWPPAIRLRDTLLFGVRSMQCFGVAAICNAPEGAKYLLA